MQPFAEHRSQSAQDKVGQITAASIAMQYGRCLVTSIPAPTCRSVRSVVEGVQMTEQGCPLASIQQLSVAKAAPKTHNICSPSPAPCTPYVGSINVSHTSTTTRSTACIVRKQVDGYFSTPLAKRAKIGDRPTNLHSSTSVYNECNA